MPRRFLLSGLPTLSLGPGYNDSIQAPPQIGLRDRCVNPDPGASNSSGFAQRIPQRPATPLSARPARPAAPCAIAHSIYRQIHLLPVLSTCFADLRWSNAAPVSTRIAIPSELKVPMRIEARDSQTSLVGLTHQDSPVWNQPALPESTNRPAIPRLRQPAKSANSP